MTPLPLINIKKLNSPMNSTIKIVILFLGLSLLTSCVSISTFIANSIAKVGDYTKLADVSYSQFNQLDIYKPQTITANKRPPVVIFFYGGCWGACQNGLQKDEYEFVADTLTANGYMVVIADYRLYPSVNFKKIIKDASEATQWVKNNIYKYGGDDTKLFLMGHSAGAHLAMMLNVQEQYLPLDVRQSIKGAIGLAGPYAFLPYTESYMPTLFGPQQNAAYSQPINYVNGNEPPMLLMYGKKDNSVLPKNIAKFAKEIRAKKGQVQTIYYKGLNHTDLVTGFIRILKNKQLITDVTAFLDKHANR